MPIHSAMPPLAFLKFIVRSCLPDPWFRRVEIGYRRARHFGTRRYCPVCGSHLRAFVAHHDDPARQFDSLCPVCGCKSPHRCLWICIQNYCRRTPKPRRLLHIAPEPHLGARLASLPNVEYVSGDLSEGVGQIQFDICNLPFDDGSFDLICCCHVLMMLPDDAPAIREMFRVLRPGGVAVIENPVASGQATIEPATEGERRRLFYDDTILRLYGDDYRSRLSAAGFVVEDADPAASLTLARGERMELYSGIVMLSLKPEKSPQ